MSESTHLLGVALLLQGWHQPFLLASMPVPGARQAQSTGRAGSGRACSVLPPVHDTSISPWHSRALRSAPPPAPTHTLQGGSQAQAQGVCGPCPSPAPVKDQHPPCSPNTPLAGSLRHKGPSQTPPGHHLHPLEGHSPARVSPLQMGADPTAEGLSRQRQEEARGSFLGLIRNIFQTRRLSGQRASTQVCPAPCRCVGGPSPWAGAQPCGHRVSPVRSSAEREPGAAGRDVCMGPCGMPAAGRAGTTILTHRGQPLQDGEPVTPQPTVHGARRQGPEMLQAVLT